MSDCDEVAGYCAPEVEGFVMQMLAGAGSLAQHSYCDL